jgi:hypothetical protein
MAPVERKPLAGEQVDNISNQGFLTGRRFQLGVQVDGFGVQKENLRVCVSNGSGCASDMQFCKNTSIANFT